MGKRLCMQCRAREEWLDNGLCFECYMEKTDKKLIQPKRESYSLLDLPGKRIKYKRNNKKKKRK